MSIRRYIGDRQFYSKFMVIVLPIIIQNGITNLVSLLDNVMVGQIGTEQMTGVSITNQILFIFNLTLFGASSGAGVFGAQFFGQGNHEGLRDTLRYKLLSGGIILGIGLALFHFFGGDFINLYLHEGSETGDLALTLEMGQEYLKIMMLGLIPFTIGQCYASTLRETGETALPMKAGLVAVGANLLLDFVLIFGKFGFPELGVAGAAIATVIARLVECLIIVVWTHAHKTRCQYVVGLYRHFSIPMDLAKQITIKGMPLMANEFLWSLGIATMNQCYSIKGLSVVAGVNITSTIINLFNVVFVAMGSAIGILIGQMLGAGEFEKAKDSARKMIFLSVGVTVLIGGVVVCTAPLFPRLYNTSDEVRYYATCFIRIMGCMMPVHAYLNSVYFTMRSGGKTLVTFFFDSFFMWVAMIPIAYCITHFVPLDIVWLYFLCQLPDAFKCIIGHVMFKKDMWIQNLVVKGR